MESTRLAIVRQALDDILERLAELPPTPALLALREKAQAYDQRVQAWDRQPPTEEARAAMLRAVLELNLEVMGAGKAPSGSPTGSSGGVPPPPKAP
jgi:hypothetical protein